MQYIRGNSKVGFSVNWPGQETNAALNYAIMYRLLPFVFYQEDSLVQTAYLPNLVSKKKQFS
jgi:hypothetical protein